MELRILDWKNWAAQVCDIIHYTQCWIEMQFCVSLEILKTNLVILKIMKW